MVSWGGGRAPRGPQRGTQYIEHALTDFVLQYIRKSILQHLFSPKVLKNEPLLMPRLIRTCLSVHVNIYRLFIPEMREIRRPFVRQLIGNVSYQRFLAPLPDNITNSYRDRHKTQDADNRFCNLEI